jgi:2-aminoethylphosphonate-pyruvate transaminase
MVEEIRTRLVSLATKSKGYSSVLMQGSGTFCVESALGSVIPDKGKLLVIVNGAYGERIKKIASVLKIDNRVIDCGETHQPDPGRISDLLRNDPEITHVAMVHCETTTGMLNDVGSISEVVKEYDRIFILDAMSSFGGIPLDMHDLGIDFMISSANKCIQGVPGFGFIIARKSMLLNCKGNARSLSLDLFDQWITMEKQHGKWRFTSPTHVVRAFYQALNELDEEGGVIARFNRYSTNQKMLVEGMTDMGFSCLLPVSNHSPIITTFLNPEDEKYEFNKFYNMLKARGYVIYPGKATDANTFRIGNIGHVYPDNIKELLNAIKKSCYWKN